MGAKKRIRRTVLLPVVGFPAAAPGGGGGYNPARCNYQEPNLLAILRNLFRLFAGVTAIGHG